MTERARPVAITGLGLVSAAGRNLEENLAALAGPEINLSPPPFDTPFTSPVFLSPLSTAELADLPPLYSRSTALGLRAAREALVCAGFAEGRSSPGAESGISIPCWPRGLRVGLAVGTSVGAALNFFDFYKATAAGKNPPLEDIRRYLASNPATALGHLLGCTGPVHCVTTACSSGTDAIGTAAAWIRHGLCDLALAGGTDELSRITYTGFCSLRLPSPRPCRPFDARRDGLNLGEGAGFMLLESETSRRERGATALAFVAGYGTATDAHSLTAPHPDGLGLTAAARQVFAQSGATWDDVAFINVHGTATQANDAAEGTFIRTHCPRIPFIATKGATGHTLGAAGAIEAVLTAAHLRAGLLPASPRFQETDPAIDLAPVNAPTLLRGSLAVSQSLAFGGNNSLLLIKGGAA